jgi:hypothetical protein
MAKTKGGTNLIGREGTSAGPTGSGIGSTCPWLTSGDHISTPGHNPTLRVLLVPPIYKRLPKFAPTFLPKLFLCSTVKNISFMLGYDLSSSLCVARVYNWVQDPCCDGCLVNWQKIVLKADKSSCDFGP